MNKIDLNGRGAIVTGGAKGIGYAIADRLLASGAKVSIWDIDGPRMAQALETLAGGADVRGDTVDVTDAEAIERGLDAAIAAFGKIDILVNNAGAVGTIGNVWEQPLENWQRMLTLNLTATFQCCRAVAPHMIGNGYGRIVNIASNAGKMGVPGNSPYAAAKAGVISLTKTMAKEAAKTGAGQRRRARRREHRTVRRSGQGVPLPNRGRHGPGTAGRARGSRRDHGLGRSEDCSFTTGAVFDISGGRADF